MKIQTIKQMNFEKNHRTIVDALGENFCKLLGDTGCILAGGALTSMFSGADINDFDVYLPSEDSLRIILAELFKKGDEYVTDKEAEALTSEMDYWEAMVCCITDKSVTLKIKESLVQLIFFDYYKTPEEIFTDFDFAANMGAFVFKSGAFECHEDFIYDVAARRLQVNPGTKFPIISLLRIGKYVHKGWKSSRKGILMLGLACANLKIRTWEECCSHLGGMYGDRVDEIFPTDKVFSLDLAIETLEKFNKESITERYKVEEQDIITLLKKLGLLEQAEKIENKEEIAF